MSTTNIPQLDLTTQYAQIEEEILREVSAVLRSGAYILGPTVKAFEEEMASYLGVKHAVGVANGSDALAIALQALGVGLGDSVAVPVYTFIATATAVKRVGARPVFVDICPSTYNIDLASLESVLGSDGLKAVIPVHLFGLCADMDRLRPLAQSHGLAILEDTAQAVGAAHGGQKAGTMGQIGSYSFFPSKNLGACGDAGLISTDDDTLAANLRCLRVHGQREKYIHAELGINSRLDSVQAAILRVKLKHLDVWNQARREVAVRYAQLFADRGIASADPNVPTPAEVTAPQEPEGYESVYHQYVVRVHESRRDKVFEALHQARIGCSIYYPLALHMQPCFADLGGREGQFPVAERACRETLALPIFPEMTLEQQERVVDVIAGVLKA